MVSVIIVKLLIIDWENKMEKTQYKSKLIQMTLAEASELVGFLDRHCADFLDMRDFSKMYNDGSLIQEQFYSGFVDSRAILIRENKGKLHFIVPEYLAFHNGMELPVEKRTIKQHVVPHTAPYLFGNEKVINSNYLVDFMVSTYPNCKGEVSIAKSYNISDDKGKVRWKGYYVPIKDVRNLDCIFGNGANFDALVDGQKTGYLEDFVVIEKKRLFSSKWSVAYLTFNPKNFVYRKFDLQTSDRMDYSSNLSFGNGNGQFDPRLIARFPSGGRSIEKMLIENEVKQKNLGNGIIVIAENRIPKYLKRTLGLGA